MVILIGEVAKKNIEIGLLRQQIVQLQKSLIQKYKQPVSIYSIIMVSQLTIVILFGREGRQLSC